MPAAVSVFAVVDEPDDISQSESSNEMIMKWCISDRLLELAYLYVGDKKDQPTTATFTDFVCSHSQEKLEPKHSQEKLEPKR